MSGVNTYQPYSGSRDPTNITDNGAGFVLVWKGSPRLLIGHPNEQRELMQLTSDIMLIAIPRYGMTRKSAHDFLANLVPQDLVNQEQTVF